MKEERKTTNTTSTKESKKKNLVAPHLTTCGEIEVHVSESYAVVINTLYLKIS